MALLSKQDLRNLFSQLTTEYEYLSNNRLKLEADCKKLQDCIEDQINQIKQINTDFEKLRQEFVQRGSESSKVYNDMSAPYREIQNDQNSPYIQQNSSYQQQQQLIQQNAVNSAPISNQNQSISNSQQPQQSQYINDQYAQQQQQIQDQVQDQQAQEEDPNQDWELATLVSADQIHDPVIISLFVEILDSSVICSTEFSPDGSCLAIGSDKMLRVYNIENNSFLMAKAINDSTDDNDESSHNYVRSIIWTSDGKTVICGSEDSKIRSFDLSETSEGKLTHCFKAGSGDVFQLQISKSEPFFAAVTSDGSLTIYSLENSIKSENDSDYLEYQKIAVLNRPCDDPSKTIAATSLSISYDSKLIAVGYTDTSVVIWDVETQQPILEQKCHSKDIYTLKFLPNGRLATASLDTTIKIWDINVTEKVITEEIEVAIPNQNQNENEENHDDENHQQKEEEDKNETENKNENETENKNENEKKEETENPNENENEKEQNQTEETQKQETEEDKSQIEQNENETKNTEKQEVTTVVKEANLELWRVVTGHTDFVLSLAVDPSGLWLLSGSKDLTARLTNLQDGLMIYCIKAHKNSIISVCFNPNGKMFCTGSGDNSVKIWSINPEEDDDT